MDYKRFENVWKWSICVVMWWQYMIRILVDKRILRFYITYQLSQILIILEMLILFQRHFQNPLLTSSELLACHRAIFSENYQSNSKTQITNNFFKHVDKVIRKAYYKTTWILSTIALFSHFDAENEWNFEKVPSWTEFSNTWTKFREFRLVDRRLQICWYAFENRDFRSPSEKFECRRWPFINMFHFLSWYMYVL